jgi:imidazolonepropionase
MRVDRLFVNARLATMATGANALGVIEHGVLAAKDGRIDWIGSAGEAPAFESDEVTDCDGRWITPGLIDCHTHLVFAGDRSDEFERRLAGESYAAIARAGGGILSTVRATRAASEPDLVAGAALRLDRLTQDGVTTIEIKSGYGLELATETKQLRAAQALANTRPIAVEPTFLGAHAVPPDSDRKAYVLALCNEMIPAVAREKLAAAVDVFCETIAFSLEETDAILRAARTHGLAVKVHAEQLSNMGGAALAARLGALSADHLEYLDEAGVAAMAEAGTVATLLPGAFYVLKEKQAPPVAALRAAAVPMAVATDANPGSSPLLSLRLAAHMACTMFGLTVPEALLAVTREAARALGRLSDIGTLEAGKWCDLAIWNVERPAEIIAWIATDPLHARVWRGV